MRSFCATLYNHTAILYNHTATLYNHTATLYNHTEWNRCHVIGLTFSTRRWAELETS